MKTVDDKTCLIFVSSKMKVALEHTTACFQMRSRVCEDASLGCPMLGPHSPGHLPVCFENEIRQTLDERASLLMMMHVHCVSSCSASAVPNDGKKLRQKQVCLCAWANGPAREQKWLIQRDFLWLCLWHCLGINWKESLGLALLLVASRHQPVKCCTCWCLWQLCGIDWLISDGGHLLCMHAEHGIVSTGIVHFHITLWFMKSCRLDSDCFRFAVLSAAHLEQFVVWKFCLHWWDCLARQMMVHVMPSH